MAFRHGSRCVSQDSHASKGHEEVLFELLTKLVMPSELYLQRQHVWGCPTCVLDPKLQDEKNLPK